MTRFEEIGQQLQLESLSKAEAKSRFKKSCDLCCNRGNHIDCDRCAIASCHRMVLETFDEMSVIDKLVKAMKTRNPEPVLAR